MQTFYQSQQIFISQQQFLQTKYNQQQNMQKRNITFQKPELFPMEELHKFLQRENINKKRFPQKNILSSKLATKAHSKSVHYYGSFNNNKHHLNLKKINQTNTNYKQQNISHQTLNAQLLGLQRKKPATSDYKSGRNNYNKISILNTKNNKISLRNSSNYAKYVSVAGISLNQIQAKQRLQSQLHTKKYIRLNKQKALEKENQKIAKRLDSQQSIYSANKMLKDYESKQKISKRLTQSKISKRSNISKQNKSVNNSSRSSVRSIQSRASSINSMRSTSRANSVSSSTRKKSNNNRFQAKLANNKKIQIVEHNINKMNQNELSKFKNIFANSFTTTNNSGSKNYESTYHNKTLIKNNPYVDIQVLSQKSQSSKKSLNSYGDTYLSNNSSNRKLREINSQINNSNKYQNKIAKKSSAITAIQNGGLLHRIAEQMYNKNTTQDFKNVQKIGKKKVDSQNSVRKMLIAQKAKQKIFASQNVTRGRKFLNSQIKYPLFPTHQIFSKA